MGLFSFLIVTALGGAAVLLCPPLAAPIAGMVGIGSAGVLAGTLAAGAQAFIGNVAAGSTFAALQSAAMLAPTP